MYFDTVVFDLDGTLADTAADLADALNHALKMLRRPQLPLDAVTLMVGHGTRALMRKGLDATGGGGDALVESGLRELTQFYENNICHHTVAYPGADEMLDELNAIGVRTAICTNKPERLAMLLVDRLGWTNKFDTIIGGNTLSVCKPDPAPLLEAIARCKGVRALYVGDSVTDAHTARAANVPFIAVSFGFREQPIDQLGADAITHSLNDLVRTVQNTWTDTDGQSRTFRPEF